VGHVIGSNNDKSKWRCATCKFLNEDELEICSRCKDPKQEFKEKKVVGGASHFGDHRANVAQNPGR
jgi:hypothetical protein